MFLKRKTREILLCLCLQAISMVGAPMRPDEIEDLLRTMHRQEITMLYTTEGDRDE